MEKLEIAVEIIFEKAVLEPAFSQTYANLCKVSRVLKHEDFFLQKLVHFRNSLGFRIFFQFEIGTDIISK